MDVGLAHLDVEYVPLSFAAIALMDAGCTQRGCWVGYRPDVMSLTYRVTHVSKSGRAEVLAVEDVVFLRAVGLRDHLIDTYVRWARQLHDVEDGLVVEGEWREVSPDPTLTSTPPRSLPHGPRSLPRPSDT